MSSLLPSLWSEPEDNYADFYHEFLPNPSILEPLHVPEPLAPTIEEMDEIAHAARQDNRLLRSLELYIPSSPGLPSPFSAPSVSIPPFPIALSSITPTFDAPIQSGNLPMSPSVPNQAAPKRQRSTNQAPHLGLLTSAVTQQNWPEWQMPEAQPGSLDELCNTESEQPFPIKYESLPVAMPLEPLLEPETACSSSFAGSLVPDAMEAAQILAMDHKFDSSMSCERCGDVHTTCSNQVRMRASLARRGMMPGCAAESRETVSEMYAVGIESFERDR